MRDDTNDAGDTIGEHRARDGTSLWPTRGSRGSNDSLEGAGHYFTNNGGKHGAYDVNGVARAGVSKLHFNYVIAVVDTIHTVMRNVFLTHYSSLWLNCLLTPREPSCGAIFVDMPSGRLCH